MPLFIVGTLVNAVAVLCGGTIGLLFRGKIPAHFVESIHRALGLCACVIGISIAIKGDFLLMVVSLALGTLTGELIRIDDRLNNFGQWMQKKLSRKEANSTFAEGFVFSTLLFCVGAMAIVGSIESGLGNDRSIIFTKSVMDGVTSIVLASSMGLGVLFSAGAILLYQGSIELFAGYLQNVLAAPLISQISAVGGVMVVGIGLNMAVNTKIKVANLLPSLLFAVGCYYLPGFLSAVWHDYPWIARCVQALLRIWAK
jgi:uncharacterized membrane protein YqgA involved in biofilm formation